MSSVSSIQKSVSNIDLSEGDSSPDKLNLSLLPSTVPSLCIPRVYKNISREKIMRIFDELKLGTVEQIDIIPIKNGGVGTDRQGSMDAGKFNRVFIHMKWNTSENSNKVRERLLSDKEIKILYEDPWFWKVRANRSQNSAPTTDRPVTVPPSRPKNPVLDFEDESEDAALRQRKAQQQQQQQQQHQKQYQPRQPYQGQGHGQSRYPPQDTRAQKYWQQQEYENEHREFARRTPAYSDPRNSSKYDADKEYGNRPQKQQQYQQQSRQYPHPRPPLAKTGVVSKAPRPVQRFRATSPSFPPPSTPPTAEAPQVAQEEKQQQQQDPSPSPSTVEPVVSTEKDSVNGAIGLADASDLSFNNQNENQLGEEEEQQQQPLEGADTVFAVDYGTVDPNITIRRKKRIVIKK